jgi:lysophospholipase L1-like esterase
MKSFAMTCAILLCAFPVTAQTVHVNPPNPQIPPANSTDQTWPVSPTREMQQIDEQYKQTLEKQNKHMQEQLQDWAQLARYRADNATLPAPAPGEQRVVFYGDSITDFWGRDGRGVFFPGRPYVNRGISGQTTPQMLVRFQQDVVHLKPSVVVILAGTNDIAGNTGPETPEMIQDNFISMAAIAKQSGIRLVLASITPAASYPWKPSIQPVEEIRALNAWLKDFCSRDGDIYLDYYSAMTDGQGGMKPGLSLDGVHPTAEGYAIMAPLAEKAISEALGK